MKVIHIIRYHIRKDRKARYVILCETERERERKPEKDNWKAKN